MSLEDLQGKVVLLDFWGAKNLGDATIIERAMRQGAIAAGGTTLHCHLKKFGEEGGVSGVLVLAESHISIHTWPERGFAAIDILSGRAHTLAKRMAAKKAFDVGMGIS